MLKKIIPIMLALCLVFSISVMAENEGTVSDNNNSQPMQEMPEQNGQQSRQFTGDMQGGFPGGMQNNNQQNQEAEPMTFGSFIKTYSTPITSVILLALAFVFVMFYKRRNY